jgi:hypothetical protein
MVTRSFKLQWNYQSIVLHPPVDNGASLPHMKVTRTYKMKKIMDTENEGTAASCL